MSSNIENMIRYNMKQYQGKLLGGSIPIPNKSQMDKDIALEQARIEISQMNKAMAAGPRDRKL